MSKAKIVAVGPFGPQVSLEVGKAPAKPFENEDVTRGYQSSPMFPQGTPNYFTGASVDQSDAATNHRHRVSSLEWEDSHS